MAKEPPSLFEPDIELLEVAGGELSQRDMPQLRDDVLVDTVFIVRLGFGTDRRLALRLIPAVHPSPEGHIRLGALRFRTPDAVPQRLSDRMVKSCHVTCRVALDRAVAQGLILKNPALSCKAPTTHPKEMQVLSQEEMQRLLIQAKENDCYELLLLELSTGLRRGELLALRWDDLDFQTGAFTMRSERPGPYSSVRRSRPLCLSRI